MNKLERECIGNELKQLNEFISLIAELPQATNIDKLNCTKIINAINDFNLRYPVFQVCLDIEDELICNNIGKGIYRRLWWVFFYSSEIEIKCETWHTDYNDHYGENYSHSTVIYLDENLPPNIQRKYQSDDLANFINDAKLYKNYYTTSLNTLLIDVSID